MDTENYILKSESQNFFTLNFDNLMNLPCHVFWKNREGNYLGYNDFGMRNLGFARNQVIGKKDNEIFPPHIAAIYRANDEETMDRKNQIFIPEQGIFKNESPILFLTYKMPLYDQKKQITGVLGIAFVRAVSSADCNSASNLSELKFAEICNHCSHKDKPACSLLSIKEKLSLQYLCKGYTVKVIGKQMNISPKTVETHIERAKIKMNCRNKTELILNFIRTCSCAASNIINKD